jgi:hypothetical protein
VGQSERLGAVGKGRAIQIPRDVRDERPAFAFAQRGLLMDQLLTVCDTCKGPLAVGTLDENLG